MSGYIKDHWLWLGLCITLAGLYSLEAALSAYVESRVNEEVDEDKAQKEPLAVTSLSLKTLKTLVDSPNPNISQMAIELVLARMQDRQVHADVYHLINADAASPDADLSQRAITTLKYLKENVDIPTRSPPALSRASTSSIHGSDLFDGLFGTGEYIIPSVREPIGGWTAVPRERPAARDEDVRRRRREAVVLHEGGGEVNEDDIIRPADLHHMV